jgi:hypothetical protein
MGILHRKVAATGLKPARKRHEPQHFQVRRPRATNQNARALLHNFLQMFQTLFAIVTDIDRSAVFAMTHTSTVATYFQS